MRRKFRRNYKRNNFSDYIINFLSICLALYLILFTYNKFSHVQFKINIPQKNISAFQMPVQNFFKLNSLSQKYNIAFEELITIYSLENNFFPNKSITASENEIEQSMIINYNQVKKKYSPRLINQYSTMFKNIISDIKYFPIAADVCTENDLPYIYGDNWEKTYRAKIPQGCNIFDRENISARIPIVSMTDGKISNINWDDSLGYNIAIISSNQNKYIYCHFDKFANNLQKNSEIEAGQLLGYMGNTQKDELYKSVHLHLCISPKTTFVSDDFFINPYLFLRLIETQKASLGD